jgi:acyl transferase domain-containing protein/acyl carrier protein
MVPPSLHCDNPNPRIPFATLNLRLVREAEPITAKKPICAGVNAFGFGGTNAHVILAAAPTRREPASSLGPMPPLAISARSAASLRELARDWRRTLTDTAMPQAPALLRAAARGRDHHPHRLMALGGDPQKMAALLSGYLDDAAPAGVVAGAGAADGKLGFVFSGNGAQFAGMGQGAWRANPVFRTAIEEVDDVLRPQLGWSVGELIDAGVDADGVARADVAQPVLFAIQVGIVEALRELGVVASGFLGHSVGEIAAAWAAGALTLPDAARVVIWRSRNQERTRGTGRMAALALADDAARELLAELDSPAEIAALNSTRSLTISAPCGEIERLAAEARRRNLWFRPLDLDFAFHSREMEPIREDLLANLQGLQSRVPRARLVSTVTGATIDAEMLDAEHWWRNIRHPVRFAEAAANLVGEGYRIFVEIGPSAVLQSYLRDALRAAGAQGRVLASLVRAQPEGDPFPEIAAQCWVAGYDLTAAPVFEGPASPQRLPLYPWQRERFWFDETAEAVPLANPSFEHPLLGFRCPGESRSWYNHIDRHVLGWIADHALEGVPIMPAAAILEIGLAAARSQWPDAAVLETRDVEVRRPLPFEPGHMRELRTAIGAEGGDWELNSRRRFATEPATLHAVGRIAAADEAEPVLRLPAAGTDRTYIAGDALYRLAEQTGLHYGPRFRTVARVELIGQDEAIVDFDSEAIGEPLDQYLLHPALLDGALQGLLGLMAAQHRTVGSASFLPWRFGRVRALAPFGRGVRRARLRLTRIGTRSAVADAALCDAAGDLVAELCDCSFRRVELSRRTPPEERALRVDLVPAPLDCFAAASVLENVTAALPRLAAARDDDPARREQAALLDALAGAIGLQAMRELVAPGQLFTLDALVDSGHLAAGSAALAESLLRLLERLGAAAEAHCEWRIEPAADLPEAPEIWRLLLAEAPDLVAELALLASAAEMLPKVLANGLRPADAVPSPMTEHLLQASPASTGAIGLLADALAMSAAAWPKDRPLRILELGAESGAARVVLDRLRQTDTAVAYTAACADPAAPTRLSPLVGSFAGVSVCHWSPYDQNSGLDGALFDIILCANACTRLRLDRHSLADLAKLLAPDGMLLAAEPEPNAVWDTVFGQEAQWWQPSSPLRTRDEWRAELAAAGFRATDAAELPAAPWPLAVFWGSAPRSTAPVRAEPVEPASVIIVGGDRMSVGALEDRLSAAGHAVKAVPAFDLSWPRGSSSTAKVVLFLAEENDSPDAAAEAARQIAALARHAAAAAQHGAAFWLITRDAQQSPQAKAGAIGAALWGLVRVLANEMPQLTLRALDLSGGVGQSERARQVVAELAADSAETEIVWTPQGRHVPRLRAGLPQRLAEPDDRLSLSASRPGLDALAWQPLPHREVGPAEVEIEVHAAGLNFRDMMWAMGLLPEEALIDGFAGPTLGLECAGIVRSIGSDVEGLAVGDRVMAFAPAALSTQAMTIAAAVARIPDQTSFAEAATVPVTFVTAIYALRHLAQLAAGEHVLIHAAAGGVGLAAIQYAKRCGAIVIATAGSEVKRAFLRQAGADHVLDSRSLAFADAIGKITGGRGVDIVLNSLSGEAMERSLEVLKPFGRFLELGKRDLYLNRRVHLRPLRQNISYFAIDVDQLPLQRPELARALLAEISAALGDGSIRPLAHRVFSFGEIDDAFRLMQSSGHIGKIVLAPMANAGVRLRPSSEFCARHDGTYLVAGGLSGFGFEAARWLVAHGAGSIALVGRRGDKTPGCESTVRELEAMGAEVRVCRADIADNSAMATVLGQIRAQGPPLRGVVHAAAVVDDGLAADIEADRALPVLHTKLGGALVLDALTRDDPLELFWMFSSATTLLGAPGQGVYVAANMALEAIARRRRAEGRPALALAWGPIADAGYLAVRPEARDALARRLGARPMAAASALDGIPVLAASGLAAVGFADTGWTDARRHLPILGAPLFSEIRARASSAAVDDSLAEQLASLDPEAAQALLTTVVAAEAAAILRLPADEIDPSRPLSQMGMDSLMAVELRLALESRLHVDLPLMSLAEGTSVRSIAERLTGAVRTGADSAEVIALAARYEAIDEARSAASELETKPVAAE